MKPEFLIFAIFLLGAAGAAPPAGAQAAGSPLKQEEVLSRWADSLGGLKNLQNCRMVHVRGTIEMGGLKGTYERWSSSRGEFRTSVDLSGVFRQTRVFDGQEGWIMDASGTVHGLTGDHLQDLITSAFEASDSFLFSSRLPGRVKFVGEDASQDAYILRLQPAGGRLLTVYLNKATFRAQREESSGPLGPKMISFSDWRVFAGLEFPGTVRQSNGDQNFDAVFTTEQVEINGPVAADLFTKPAEAASSVQFAGGAHEAITPAEIYAEHVFVPVRLNGGAAAAWLFVDSGAAQSLIDKSWADRAAVKYAGAIQGLGTGAGSTSMAMAGNVVFELPGAHVTSNSVLVWDLSPVQPAMGRAWDGVLGYDVLSGLVVRVDYEHEQVSFRDPATFVPSDHAAALPVTFLGNLPLVHAQITLPGREPVDVLCAIDSGAGGFHLSTPFARANHVSQSITRTIASSSVGAGGVSRELKGRITSLQLGPFTLREPVTAFAPDETGGLLANPQIGALIGGEILSRFAVTFDFPHQRITLEPNGAFANVFQTNQTGLGLVAKGPGFHQFQVDYVEPGSPAESAGIQPGDNVTAFDNLTADKLDLNRIDEILQQSGRSVELTLNRKGKTFKTSLKLVDRI